MKPPEIMNRAIEIFELTVVATILGVLAFFVVGVCAAIVPFRWFIQWRIQRKAEGDRLTS